MACIGLNKLLKVSVSTYNGPLDFSEAEYEWIREDLKDNSTNGKIEVEGEGMVDVNDIDGDYNINWERFNKSVCDAFEEELDGTITKTHCDKGYEKINDLFAKYGMEYQGLKWFSPQYYNYNDDSVDMYYDLVDENWSLEKYGLTELVQKYIDEVRVRSYDGYQSFEPSKIDEVCWNDYCVMWAILQKENMFDELHNDCREMLYDYGYEMYMNSIESYTYYYNNYYYKMDWTGGNPKLVLDINNNRNDSNI